MRRTLLFLGAVAMIGVGLAHTADATHSCYPSVCTRGDAAITGVSNAPLVHGQYREVCVEGVNNGARAFIIKRLKRTGGSKASIKPGGEDSHGRGHAKNFTEADTPLSHCFGVKPKSAGSITLLACVTAQKDLDRSNDCGTFTLPVT